jgi:cell division protein FtsZ
VNEAAEIVAKAAHPDANIIFGAVIDDSLGDEVRITVIAAGFDRYDGEKRPSRGLTSLGLDLDDDLSDGIDFSSGGSGSDDDADDQFDVPEFLR